ncbi:MAG: hypothetical protein M0Q87_14935 [Ottowia sp.]|nr:hypothetical protein [Ottowia sp.]
MSELKFSTAFIELDCLLDTRMGTLTSMGDSSIKAALDYGYYDRGMDLWPGVNETEFKKLYASRDKIILMNSFMTLMGGILKDFVKKTIEQVINTPFHYKPKVVVNIHPYVLTEDEVTNIILAVKQVTLGLADIEVVDLSYEQITPIYVRENLSLVIMYEYYKWLEIHSANGNFKKVSCPEVGMFGPGIYFKKPDYKPKDNENPFEALEQLAAPFIALKLLPIEFFSIAVKLKKKA